MGLRINKLALIGFVLGPVFLTFVYITRTIAGPFLRETIDPLWDLTLIPFIIALVPVSYVLALISLFTRKDNQKGKWLAITTLIAPFVFYFLPFVKNMVVRTLEILNVL